MIDSDYIYKEPTGCSKTLAYVQDQSPLAKQDQSPRDLYIIHKRLPDCVKTQF